MFVASFPDVVGIWDFSRAMKKYFNHFSYSEMSVEV